ncbi:MAG: translocation protein TolB [Pseudobdellovibrionaceae bacterium]
MIQIRKNFKGLKTQILISLCSLLLMTGVAHGQNEFLIKVGDAKTKKSLLAFPPLALSGTSSSKAIEQGTTLFNVILNDLTVSSYFQLIDQKAYLENTAKTGLRPKPTDPNGFSFESWKAIGSDFLIRGGYTVNGQDIELEIYAYSVGKADLVLGKKYKGTVNTVRRIAHTFSNDLIKALTGSESMFNSKIVVTSDKAGGGFREVYVMDWDGTAIQKITNHKTVSISPNWSPDGQRILYTSFVKTKRGDRNPDMYLYETRSGERLRISYRKGTNSGGFFTPDNKGILLTLSQSGNPDIYRIGFDGGIEKRITNGPIGAMNVEPAMNSINKKIAFSSDRHGRPMIYTMDENGSNVTRVTFAGQFNSSPSWSPDGTKLAFAGQSGSNFDIFVMDANGSNMVRLTSAKKSNGRMSSNEDPSFSPCGRFVMFTSNRTGKNQIYISTLDGQEERRITSDNHNYFKPKWSSNL